MKAKKNVNEIIARFMDLPIRAITPDGSVFIEPEKGFLPKECRFTKSWDELHCAWDKWKKVSKGYSGFHGWRSSLKESITMTKVHQASHQLAKGIEWYNSQKTES